MAAKKIAVQAPVGFAFNFGPAVKITPPAEYNAAFRVRKDVADKVSSPVTILALHFDEKARQIRVFGSDGLTRKCNVDRLPDTKAAKALWVNLQKIGKAQTEISFVAAGGYSPDVWFYTVK